MTTSQHGAQTLDAGKLSIGDKVRVARKVTGAPGWNDVWVDSMDACVGDGVSYKITALPCGGFFLEPCGWNFPAEALEVVERARKPEAPAKAAKPDWKARAEAAEAKLSAAEARADALAEALKPFADLARAFDFDPPRIEWSHDDEAITYDRLSDSGGPYGESVGRDAIMRASQALGARDDA